MKTLKQINIIEEIDSILDYALEGDSTWNKVQRGILIIEIKYKLREWLKQKQNTFRDSAVLNVHELFNELLDELK